MELKEELLRRLMVAIEGSESVWDFPEVLEPLQEDYEEKAIVYHLELLRDEDLARATLTVGSQLARTEGDLEPMPRSLEDLQAVRLTLEGHRRMRRIRKGERAEAASILLGEDRPQGENRP